MTGMTAGFGSILRGVVAGRRLTRSGPEQLHHAANVVESIVEKAVMVESMATVAMCHRSMSGSLRSADVRFPRVSRA